MNVNRGRKLHPSHLVIKGAIIQILSVVSVQCLLKATGIRPSLANKQFVGFSFQIKLGKLCLINRVENKGEFALQLDALNRGSINTQILIPHTKGQLLEL